MSENEYNVEQLKTILKAYLDYITELDTTYTVEGDGTQQLIDRPSWLLLHLVWLSNKSGLLFNLQKAKEVYKPRKDRAARIHINRLIDKDYLETYSLLDDKEGDRRHTYFRTTNKSEELISTCLSASIDIMILATRRITEQGPVRKTARRLSNRQELIERFTG